MAKTEKIRNKRQPDGLNSGIFFNKVKKEKRKLRINKVAVAM